MKNLRLTGSIDFNISGTTTNNAGAVAGTNNGTIRNVSSGVNVRMTPTQGSPVGNAGGIAGRNAGTIENSYSTGNVTITLDGALGGSPLQNAGGISGENSAVSSIIENCWASGTIEISIRSNNTYVGGIAGNSSNNDTVSNCVALNPSLHRNIGSFSSTNPTGGRIFGMDVGDTIVGINNYALSTMVITEEINSPIPQTNITDNIIGKDGGDFTNPTSSGS